MNRTQIVLACITLNVFLGLVVTACFEYWDIDFPNSLWKGLLLGSIIAMPGLILQIYWHSKYF